MGGGKGGGSSVNVEPSPYESQMAKIAKELYDSTADLRTGFLRDYESILGVGSGAGYGSQGNYMAPPVFSQPASQSYVPQLTPVAVQTGSIDDPGGGWSTIFQNLAQLKPVTATPTFTQGGGSQYESAYGRYDPTKLPTYKPLFGLQKQSLESQYQQAKNNILASTPTGGNLAGSLGNLETGRATAMGAMPAELSAGILNDMLNKAYGAAFQTPTTTLSGLSTAAGTYGNRQAAAMAQAAADQQSTYGLLGGLGGALGQGIGKAIGGK
jgi:hypothetical protein